MKHIRAYIVIRGLIENAIKDYEECIITVSQEMRPNRIFKNKNLKITLERIFVLPSNLGEEVGGMGVKIP